MLILGIGIKVFHVTGGKTNSFDGKDLAAIGLIVLGLVGAFASAFSFQNETVAMGSSGPALYPCTDFPHVLCNYVGQTTGIVTRFTLENPFGTVVGQSDDITFYLLAGKTLKVWFASARSTDATANETSIEIRTNAGATVIYRLACDVNTKCMAGDTSGKTPIATFTDTSLTHLIIGSRFNTGGAGAGVGGVWVVSIE
jgi:hypothetical protein